MSKCEHKDFIFIGKKSEKIEVSWCRQCGSIRETEVRWLRGYTYNHKDWVAPENAELEKERDDLLEQIKSIRNDSYKFGYKEAIKGKPMMTFEQYVNYKRIDEREGE